MLQHQLPQVMGGPHRPFLYFTNFQPQNSVLKFRLNSGSLDLHPRLLTPQWYLEAMNPMYVIAQSIRQPGPAIPERVRSVQPDCLGESRLVEDPTAILEKNR